MYFLPFYIKKYTTSASAESIVKTIRANTANLYNSNGVRSTSNRNGLMFRNETEKGIFLKDKHGANRRYGGGSTAIYVSDDADKTVLTTISFYGWDSSMMLAMFVLVFFYLLLNDPMSAIYAGIGVLIFNFLIALFCKKSLLEQRDFIERVIEQCESN